MQPNVTLSKVRSPICNHRLEKWSHLTYNSKFWNKLDFTTTTCVQVCWFTLCLKVKCLLRTPLLLWLEWLPSRLRDVLKSCAAGFAGFTCAWRGDESDDHRDKKMQKVLRTSQGNATQLWQHNCVIGNYFWQKNCWNMNKTCKQVGFRFYNPDWNLPQNDRHPAPNDSTPAHLVMPITAFH